ncbi:MAG: hypothetical protein GXP39_19925 [Chloroflexi bacterium]|nr:hypothetical protein [Chloroflexota bacterium]
MEISERALQEQICEIGRRAVRYGLVKAISGNISARPPGADRFWITATGTALDALTPDDLVCVDLNGCVCGGERPPSSEYQLHLAIYQRRPEINAIVHLHPPLATVVGTALGEVRPMTFEGNYFLGDVAVVPPILPGTQEVARAAAEASDESRVLVLQHHGSVCLGEDLEEALYRSVELEETCRLIVIARAMRSTCPGGRLSGCGATGTARGREAGVGSDERPSVGARPAGWRVGLGRYTYRPGFVLAAPAPMLALQNGGSSAYKPDLSRRQGVPPLLLPGDAAQAQHQPVAIHLQLTDGLALRLLSLPQLHAQRLVLDEVGEGGDGGGQGAVGRVLGDDPILDGEASLLAQVLDAADHLARQSLVHQRFAELRVHGHRDAVRGSHREPGAGRRLDDHLVRRQLDGLPIHIQRQRLPSAQRAHGRRRIHPGQRLTHCRELAPKARPQLAVVRQQPVFHQLGLLSRHLQRLHVQFVGHDAGQA